GDPHPRDLPGAQASVPAQPDLDVRARRADRARARRRVPLDGARAVRLAGRLAAEVGALATLVARSPATPVDVVVSPMLLTQLSRMRNGYTVIDGGTEREVGEGEGGAAAAASVLSALERIAGSPSVELSALPFSSPSLPALAASGLGRDLDVQ